MELNTRLTKSTSSINDDIVSTTKDPDKFTNLISDRIELQNEIRLEVCRAYKEMKFIENVIRKLPEREKLLMRLRYIDGHKWEVICVEMGYEWAQIHRLHSKILKTLENKQS